jgi:hypothetical protein
MRKRNRGQRPGLQSPLHTMEEAWVVGQGAPYERGAGAGADVEAGGTSGCIFCRYTARVPLSGSLCYCDGWNYWENVHAQTCEASATLLCLKGLKSSLIFTGVLFLMGRVPKNGLGVDGDWTQDQHITPFHAEWARSSQHQTWV